MERVYFYGAVPRTSLSTTINASATSIVVADATGWPTTGPFDIILERNVNEEIVRIASRTGNVLTVATSGRGFDSTTAVAHTAATTCYVEHVLSANYMDAVSTALALQTAKGDLLGHNGTALVRKAVGTNGFPLVARSSDAAGVAYEQVAAGGIADDAVTTAKILNANVTQAKLATDSVGSAQIIALNVDSAEINTGAVTSSKLGADAVISGKIADDAIDDLALFASPVSPIYHTGGDPVSGILEGQLIARTDLDRMKVATSTTTVVPMGLGPWWTSTGRLAVESARNTTAQTIATATPTYLQADIENADPLSMGATSTNAIWTIPTGMTGLWLCYHRIWATANLNTTEVQWHVDPAGTPQVLWASGAEAVVPMTAAFYMMCNATTILDLTAGQVIGIKIQHAGGANRDLKWVAGLIFIGP